jgi:sodium transport system permease protein
MTPSLRAVVTVLRKELVDALRDRRTLVTVLVSSVLLGPLVLVAISSLVASLESRAEQREVYVAGLAAAPTLRNYLERQTYTVKEAPADYEARLRKATFTDPVVVVPADFETALVRGDVPVVEIVSDSANQRSEAGAGRIERLLGGFSRERAVLSLALRGVSLQLLEPMEVEARDLRSTQTRATRITGMLPFFVLMAVLYGALNAGPRHDGRRARARLARAAADEPRGALGARRRQVGRGRVREHAHRRAQQLQLPARAVGAPQRHPGRRCSSTGRARRCSSSSCCCRWQRAWRRC